MPAHDGLFGSAFGTCSQEAKIMVKHNSTRGTGRFGKVLRRLKAVFSELTPIDTCDTDRLESWAVPGRRLLGWRCWTIVGKAEIGREEGSHLSSGGREEDVSGG